MLRVTGRLKLPTSGCSDGPESVDAVKYRYFPSRSNTGSFASLMPSVICVALPDASEYTRIAPR